MSMIDRFVSTLRKAARSYRTSYTMRDILAVYVIVLAALAASFCDAQAAATKTTIYNFQGGADGGFPEMGLAADTDGVLYGVSAGGPYGSGLVYRMTPPATGSTQWTKTTLYAFRGGADGAFPQSGLIFDSNGALYGVTREGGAGAGTIFMLSPPLVAGGAWTKTTLYSFNGSTDGATPLWGLTMDTSGALYGTTNQQGAGAGTVYKLTPPAPGATAWTYATLYAFQGNLDGSNPYGGVVFDTDGALYGTTAFGGHRGAGTVFKLAPAAPGAGWTKTQLYSFDGVEGNFPRATVTFGTNGGIFGVTYGGGAYNAGTVYKLMPPAAGSTQWTKNTLYNFNPTVDGANPYSELTFDTTGALYGSTFNGGPNGAGGVFKLNPPASTGLGQWSIELVYSFQGGPDGQSAGGLVFDNKGTLYGVTYYGGANWNGSVFMLALPPAPGLVDPADTVLYGFLGGADGANPQEGTPTFDSRGSIYTTTSTGGANGYGSIVKLTRPAPGGARWTKSIIYNFTGAADGANPLGCLTFDTDGALYGMTTIGGNGHGVVFQLNSDDADNAKWTYKTIYKFSGDDGSNPQCGMVFDTKGSLYGVTRFGGARGYGVAFRLKPNAGSLWQYNALYTFTGGADGGTPNGGLVFDTDGDLYGVTTAGGLGYGVVYRLRPGEHNVNSKFWNESVLYAFGGSTDGSNAYGPPVFDNHGALYGIVRNGGEKGYGAVFKLKPGEDDKPWTKRTLYSFLGGVDGATPNNVTFDTMGALYATTQTGGNYNKGTLVKMTAAGNGWAKSTLHHFNGPDGSNPMSGVIFDTQGGIVGTTNKGGGYGYGSVFRVR